VAAIRIDHPQLSAEDLGIAPRYARAYGFPKTDAQARMELLGGLQVDN
jgi:hypothetical protein